MTRTDEAVRIQEFPEYLITREGLVYTEKTGQIRKPSFTTQGTVKITLFKGGQPYTRSLALLVAKAYVYNDHDPELFDTPIHLDNDRRNNHADNLMWRPRWFAVKYQMQYWNPEYRHATTRVEDAKTGETFHSLVHVCQTYGFLFHDVIASCTRGTYVFPSWKIYRFL